MTTLGIISDTHGLLRPEALDALAGVDLILHAGDIGDRAIITALESIAPVHAIHGNVDGGALAREFPATATVEIAGKIFFLIHDIAALDFDPATRNIDAVIYGHSHKPTIETRAEVLYLNPGSAGPRRFSLPVTVATLEIDDGHVQPTLHELKV